MINFPILQIREAVMTPNSTLAADLIAARALSPEKIADLIARVAAATGPDREIDCLIAVAIDGFFEIPERYEGDGIGYGYINDDGVAIHPGHGGAQLVRRYTASIDADLALVERRLPGHQVNIYVYGMRSEASIGNLSRDRHEAVTPPLAILLALLSALSPDTKEA